MARLPGVNPAVKRKRQTHTLQTKYDAILAVALGEKTKTQIANELRSPPNTLATWLKKADEYKEAYEKQTFGPANKRMKKGSYSDVDDALDLFMRQARARDCSGPILIGEAQDLAP